ncbi:hypothetical protein C8J57DRAFT_1530305 [Mycena rebaudengoi]|nr:hypothetical protein C8J57DRAFT_1530305 [Mycena rebaudengoi]
MPVSAWVGSVGKKWEEPQRAPSYAKNSKRASLLLSDIAYALQVGPAPTSPSLALLSSSLSWGASLSSSHAPSSASHSSSHASPAPSSSYASRLDARRTAADACVIGEAGVQARDNDLDTHPRESECQTHARGREAQADTDATAQARATPQAQAKTLDDDGEEWNW